MNNPLTGQTTVEDSVAFQVRRLRFLKGYPQREDDELIRVARKYPITPESLCDAISDLIEECSECPTAAELSKSLQAHLPPPPDKVEQWKREGATYDPDFGPDLLATMTGKNSDEQYRALRVQGIRDALEAIGDRQCDQKFWAAHLKWAEDNHPDEVAMQRIAMRVRREGGQ